MERPFIENLFELQLGRVKQEELEIPFPEEEIKDDFFSMEDKSLEPNGFSMFLSRKFGSA